MLDMMQPKNHMIMDQNCRRQFSTILHLRALPSSMSSCRFQVESGKSMKFQWKAIGWTLSHFGFQFHGNSHFFVRNSNGNGWNPRASRNDSQNPWNSIGILLKFCWNPMGTTIIYIVKTVTQHQESNTWLQDTSHVQTKQHSYSCTIKTL